jgi:hypothetical protein
MSSRPFRALRLIALLAIPNSIASTCPAVLSDPAPEQDPNGLIPDHLRFTGRFVRSLRDAGVSVKAVNLSVYQALFTGTKQAAAVNTDRGAASVVVFSRAEDVEQIRVELLPRGDEGRYIYRITEKPDGPSKRINAARPVYFVTSDNMLIITGDREFARTIEDAFKD